MPDQEGLPMRVSVVKLIASVKSGIDLITNQADVLVSNPTKEEIRSSSKFLRDMAALMREAVEEAEDDHGATVHPKLNGADVIRIPKEPSKHDLR